MAHTRFLLVLALGGSLPLVAEQPSNESLRHFLRKCLAVAREKDEASLAVLVKELEIPDYEQWFNATFGPSGLRYAQAYGTNLTDQGRSRQQMLRVTAQRTKDVRVRRVNDEPAARLPPAYSAAFETGVRRNLQRPVTVFCAYYTNTPRASPLGYFVFVDGKFRWWSGFSTWWVDSKVLP